MSFAINKKLIFIGSFQFRRSSLDNLIKNLDERDFKYFSQHFDNNVLDIIEQKWFYTYGCSSDFEKFKGELPSKEKFYSSLTDTSCTDKEYRHVVNVCIKFEIKTTKDYCYSYLKCGVLFLCAFGKFRNNRLKIYGLCRRDYLSASGLSWDLILRQILICSKYSLKKVEDVKFLQFLIDIGKPTINI